MSFTTGITLDCNKTNPWAVLTWVSLTCSVVYMGKDQPQRFHESHSAASSNLSGSTALVIFLGTGTVDTYPEGIAAESVQDSTRAKPNHSYIKSACLMGLGPNAS